MRKVDVACSGAAQLFLSRGFKHVDALQIDVEGAELDIVADLLWYGVRPRVILFEVKILAKDVKRKHPALSMVSLLGHYNYVVWSSPLGKWGGHLTLSNMIGVGDDFLAVSAETLAAAADKIA